jgi:DNA polymerase III subunit epsilon
MKNCFLYANLYYNFGFNVTCILGERRLYTDPGPNVLKSPSHEWLDLSSRRQSLEELHLYEWQNAVGIGVVLGFNELRALDIDDCSDPNIAIDMLEILGLPPNYEWITISGSRNGFHILFYAKEHDYIATEGKIRAFKSQFFKRLELRWQGHLVLPPSSHLSKHYYDFINTNVPLKGPETIQLKSIHSLVRRYCAFNNMNASPNLASTHTPNGINSNNTVNSILLSLMINTNNIVQSLQTKGQGIITSLLNNIKDKKLKNALSKPYEVFVPNVSSQLLTNNTIKHKISKYNSEDHFVYDDTDDDESDELLYQFKDEYYDLAIKHNVEGYIVDSSSDLIEYSYTTSSEEESSSEEMLFDQEHTPSTRTPLIQIDNKSSYPVLISMNHIGSFNKIQNITSHLDELNSAMYMFFDVETTGKPINMKSLIADHNNWPRIVEIAWQITTRSGYVIHKENHIVKPNGFEIPKDSTNIHGITTKHALEYGLHIEDVLARFEYFTYFCHAIVAHNIEFDNNVIAAEYSRLSMSNPLDKMKKLCTMKGSYKYCSIPGPFGYKWPKLSELYEKLFDEQLTNSHSALIDTEATVRCFWKLKRLGRFEIG